VKRDLLIRPAWDHVVEPCRPGGCGHGRGREEWVYHVRSDDGLAAASLGVFSPICHPSTPSEVHEVLRSALGDGGFAHDLSLHVGWIVDPIRGYDREECFALSGPCSVAWSSSLSAIEFWSAHAKPGEREQPEAFWVALEKWLARRDEAARAERREVTS
jgi:hypothetical protein